MLNREPKLALKMRFVSDPLNHDNHTFCSPAYKSTTYPDLRLINPEACEQFDSVLRCVQGSVSFMTYEHYFKLVQIFAMFYNMRGLE